MLRTILLLMIGLCLTVLGCGHQALQRAPSSRGALLAGEKTQEEVTDALRSVVKNRIEYTTEHRDEFKNEVLDTRVGGERYYYRTYDEYPDGAWGFVVDVTKTSSPLATYEATVTYRKIGYETVLYKSKRRARRDKDFIRDEGVQRDHYVLTGGLWSLKGSTFEVSVSSVYEADRWVRRRDIKRMEEEKPELFLDKIGNLFRPF